jgi:hypothetical protein
VFVDRAAESMLMKKLKSSRFGDKQIIGDMIETFEKKVCTIIIALCPPIVLMSFSRYCRQKGFLMAAKSLMWLALADAVIMIEHMAFCKARSR